MSDRSDQAPLSKVELLTRAHVLAEFDCGTQPSLNDWLKRYAVVNQQSDSARTYVVHRNSRVVGYYSLAPGSVRKQEAPARIAKGLANHPIGIILLARLAVDKTERGAGLGGALLKDALMRAVHGAEIISARAVLVHAIDDDAKSFYKHFGFENCPVDPMHLMLLLKDIRQLGKR